MQLSSYSRLICLLLFTLIAYEGNIRATVKVSVVHLMGQVEPRMYTSFLQQLKAACIDKETQAILINANSGGGDLYQPFLKAIATCNLRKHIWILVHELCASACYYTSAGAHRIIVSPLAMIGSIGIRQNREYLHAARISYNNINFTLAVKTFFKVNDNFDVSKFEPISDHEQEIKNQLVQEFYDNFIAYVRQHRPQLQDKEPSEWADAKIFSSKKALQLGLIDKIGSLSDVLDEIASEFKTNAHDIELVENQQALKQLQQSKAH